MKIKIDKDTVKGTNIDPNRFAGEYELEGYMGGPYDDQSNPLTVAILTLVVRMLQRRIYNLGAQIEKGVGSL